MIIIITAAISASITAATAVTPLPTARARTHTHTNTNSATTVRDRHRDLRWTWSSQPPRPRPPSRRPQRRTSCPNWFGMRKGVASWLPPLPLCCRPVTKSSWKPYERREAILAGTIPTPTRRHLVPPFHPRSPHPYKNDKRRPSTPVWQNAKREEIDRDFAWWDRREGMAEESEKPRKATT